MNINRLGWITLIIYVFIRPFVSAPVFPIADIWLNSGLLLSFCFCAYKNNLKLNNLDLIISLFFLSLSISTVNSTDLTKTLPQLHKFLLLFILYLTIRLSGKKRNEEIKIILLISATFLSAYTLRTFFISSQNIINFISLNKIDNDFALRVLQQKRAFAPFFSSNALANYLAIIAMLPLATIAKQFDSRNKNYRFFLNLGFLFLISYVIFLTKSIGGWLSFSIGFMLFATLSKKINRKTLILLASLGVITIVIILHLRASHGDLSTTPLFSLEKRIGYWKQTWAIICKHPILGAGLGNFYLAESKSAHNSYLQIWAEMGIFSFMFWILIVYISIKEALKNILKSNSYHAIAILSSLVVFLVHNIFDYTFFIPQVAFLFWITVALIQNSFQDTKKVTSAQSNTSHANI